MTKYKGHRRRLLEITVGAEISPFSFPYSPLLALPHPFPSPVSHWETPTPPPLLIHIFMKVGEKN